MPHLHQDTCRPDTCIPDEQLVSGYIYVDGYKLLVRDTCRLYLDDIITIHLCYGRLVSLCIQQQTGDKLATILSPIQDTCRRRRQVDTTCIRQHVSWCKRVISLSIHCVSPGTDTKAAFTPDTCSRIQVFQSQASNLYSDTSGYMSP